MCRYVYLYVRDCIWGVHRQAGISETLFWFSVEREEKEIQALGGVDGRVEENTFFFSHLDIFQNFFNSL